MCGRVQKKSRKQHDFHIFYNFEDESGNDENGDCNELDHADENENTQLISTSESEEENYVRYMLADEPITEKNTRLVSSTSMMSIQNKKKEDLVLFSFLFVFFLILLNIFLIRLRLKCIS